MEHVTPEAVGIASENIYRFLESLENSRMASHDLILARGDKIFFENYWEPFHKDFLHRMYSVSKSFVSIAIGFLAQDGKISLDDKLSQYLEEDFTGQQDENIRNQTIRHMLMMSTAKTAQNWFVAKPQDRVRFYCENDGPYSRPSGIMFEYDSDGSFVLGALVERLTGMPFMEYLREKLFRKIGVSEEAYCLKCPGGHSWGDSAVLCKPSDLLLVARFMLNRGRWNGEQILNEKYVAEATSLQVSNNYMNFEKYNVHGYGYQFWITYQNAFLFNGMGCQYALCVPEQDIIMVYNADNQGKEEVINNIFIKFYELIVNPAKCAPLPENPTGQIMQLCIRIKVVDSSGRETCTGRAESKWRDLAFTAESYGN